MKSFVVLNDSTQIPVEDDIKAEEHEQSKEISTTMPKEFLRKWRTQKDLSLDNIIGEIWCFV